MFSSLEFLMIAISLTVPCISIYLAWKSDKHFRKFQQR